MSKKAMKVISSALLAYLIIMIATALVGGLVEEGILLDAWYSMIRAIPFGGSLATFCIELFGDSFNMGHTFTQYTIGVKALSVLEVFEDTCLVVVTAVFYEALHNFFQEGFKVKGKEGILDICMKMIWGMVSALLSTYIAALTMNFLYSQMHKLPSVAQGIIATVVSMISIGGTVGVMFWVLGVGILGAIAYVVVKILLVNVLKVLATYCGTLLVLLFVNEGAYTKVFGAFAGWGVVIIILIGVDLMITSMIDK